MKKIILFVLAILACMCMFSQNQVRDFSISVLGGVKEYAGEYGNEFYQFDRDHVAFGLSLAGYIDESWDVMGMISYGQISNGNDTSYFSNRLFNLSLLAKYKFANGYILKQDARVAPYLFAGIGDAIMRAEHYTDEFDMAFNFPAGVGLDIHLNDWMALNVQSTYHYTIKDNLDNLDLGGQLNWHDQFMFHSIGLKFSLARNDKDRDGVKNAVDLCPQVPGLIANDGCPDVSAGDKEVMRRAMEGLFFETGSAVIKSESYNVLDKVAEIMAIHPEYALSIEGHTDNTGSDEVNQRLSTERASAARAYLIEKGVDEGRIYATGYGSTRPKVSNDTDEGRATNRRVEFRLRMK
ncbi:OmpA family protein [Sanyastnella coralliicola]|uniref:OmpA family protein n=1 Tax=Sanyastnella coralliicola TaxID=3069118 RepID=UPI0027B94203|nr:OmpA family protein [Longitalea sp. SCSIO 12813]